CSSDLRTGSTDDAAGTSDESAGTGGEGAHPAESAASSRSEAGSSAGTAAAGPTENTAESSAGARSVTATSAEGNAGSAASAGEESGPATSAGESTGPADGARPWYSRPPARALMIAVTLAGLAYALMFFRGLQDIVAPVFLALNFYIVVYPVQRALTRLKVPRAIGACLSVVLVLCMIIAFFGLTAWSVAELVI